MATRIKTQGEFLDKIDMARSIQKLIKDEVATENDKTIFLVLIDEIKEYNEELKTIKNE